MRWLVLLLTVTDLHAAEDMVGPCVTTIKAPVTEMTMDEPLKAESTGDPEEFSRKRPSGVVAASVTARSGDAPDTAPSHPAFLAQTEAILFVKQALTLNLRTRSKVRPGEYSEKQAQWDPTRTALVICDMWDDHWCKSAARRVAEMAPALNATAKAARSKGVFIIHSPSTCVDFYKDTAQRQRAQRAPFKPTPVPVAQTPRWGTTWCWPDSKREGVLPIDDSDMGCDCAQKCVIRDAWKRQIATIQIMPEDAISDNAQEIWNLLSERGIENVILCGVHLNMCVLGRPFGIRQMTYFGKNVALLRDLTDTMYNPERPPGVSHFGGTDLVVEHVEKYWCPSFTSQDITGHTAFRFK